MYPWGPGISFYIKDVNATRYQGRHDKAIPVLGRVTKTTGKWHKTTKKNVNERTERKVEVLFVCVEMKMETHC